MKHTVFSLVILPAVLCVAACATVANIPEELSPAELIQRAQEAKDNNRYGISLQYYRTLMERNATNPDLVCEAEYEIAFIHYKQKNYDMAKKGFNALLERYEFPGGEDLPEKFRILSSIVLDSIAEKEAPRPRPGKRGGTNAEEEQDIDEE